jgi:hypothetical protein
MANIYIDNTNGDDTTGDGSSGNPYQTLSKAFSVLTSNDAIYVANTSAQSFNSLAFPAVTFTADKPLLITGWDNGGTLEINSPLGNNRPCGVFSNNGATNAQCFTNSLNFTVLRHIKFENYETNCWTSVKTSNSLFECEFDNCYSLGSFGNQSFFIGNTINASTTNVTFATFSGCNIIGNYFYNIRDLSMSTSSNSVVSYNIFDRCRILALNLGSGDGRLVFGNTFIGRNLGSASSDIGIDYTNANNEYNNITGNHFQDYTGSGGKAIRARFAPTAGSTCTFLTLGRNSFYNVDNRYDASLVTATLIDLTSEDITETSDPLPNKGTLDFKMISGSLSFNNGSIREFLNTLTDDVTSSGAVQYQPSGGSSGPTGYISG